MNIREKKQLLMLLHCSQMSYATSMSLCMLGSEVSRQFFRTQLPDSKLPYSLLRRAPFQLEHNFRLFTLDDTSCINQTIMDRNFFLRLCLILKSFGGLEEGKHVSVKQVAIFLIIVAHNKKNRVALFDFNRSGETVSKYFNRVLSAILKLHKNFMAETTPVNPDNAEDRWQYFQEYKDADRCIGVDYPLFETWAEWFGHDRATGDAAIGFEEAVNLGDDDAYHVDLTNIIDDEFETTSNINPSQVPAQELDDEEATVADNIAGADGLPPPAKKKKPITKGDRATKIAKPYVDFMKQQWSENKKILEDMALKMKSEDDVLDEKCVAVTTILESFPLLSTEQHCFLENRILANTSTTKLFIKAPRKRQEVMIDMLLQKKLI